VVLNRFHGRKYLPGALRVLILGIFLLPPGRLAASQPADQNFLPKMFAGWQEYTSKTSTDAAVADPVNASVLQEFGFTDFAQAAYRRPDQRQLTVKAVRFADASGAYGAFTFYKLPQMLNEKFGDQGASLNERVLFYRGSVLVEARFDKTTAMSAAELRELSDALPLPSGPARNLPVLPQYLPKQGYVKNSAKYVMGPLGLTAAGTPVPPELIAFARGAEVAEGKYSTALGTATLMLLEYPTPQIATERLHIFEGLNQNPPPAPDPTLQSPFTIKRTGPIVALVAGQVSAGEAKSLLATINYDADVTWNQNTFLDKKNNVANLLVNVIYLIAIILGFALVIGVAFGGARLLMKRFFPGRVFDRAEDMEIIQLGLGTGKKNM
jgi:hypothetical protein